MMNWKRILATVGATALLASNLGSVTQTVFAGEDYTEDLATNTSNDSSNNNDQSSEGYDQGKEESRQDAGTLISVDNDDLLSALSLGKVDDNEGEGINLIDGSSAQGGGSNNGSGSGQTGDGTDKGGGSSNNGSDDGSGDNDGAGAAGDTSGQNQNGSDTQGTDGTAPTGDSTSSNPNTNQNTASGNGESGSGKGDDKTIDLDDSLTFELETKESGKRETRRDGDVYLYNIGETASTTITIRNPEDYTLKESDDAVVRLYMQFTDTASTDDEDEETVHGKTKSAGTYTAETADGEEYEYTVYELEDGITCYEFERPVNGDSYEVELTSVYKEIAGKNEIWGAVLSEDDKDALDKEAAEALAESKDEQNKADPDTPSSDEEDDEPIIGVVDRPEDDDEITVLRWLHSDENGDYPVFTYSEEMSDGTVIDIDAPEGAFPKGIQVALAVKDPADYLDVIRAYRELDEDAELSTENWLAYDFDFYTDDAHHNIEPETDIKVTFSHLTRLTELAEEAAAAAAENASDEEAIALANVAEDEDSTNSGESSEESLGVGVYHIADTDSDADANDAADAVTRTTVTEVDPEEGTIVIETDAFSTQLLDLDDGIMLVPGPGGNTATESTTVDHIDIGILANTSITINGQQQTISVGLVESDFTAGNVTVTAKRQNGGSVNFNTNNFSNITTSTGTSGIQQYRVGGTYQTGTLSNPAVYTFTLKKNVTFTVDGQEVTLPVTLSESFHYFQSDNDCPGIHNNENEQGKVSDASGLDFVLKFDIKLIVVYKEVVDENGNLLTLDNSYTANFTVDKSVDSEGVEVNVDQTTGKGFGVEQVSEISEVTLTEQTPPQTVVSNGQTYNYLKTTIEGQDVTRGLSYTGNNVSSFTVKNYYSGKPLEIEKKWYESDGTTEITDNSRLPESISGTLYQFDHADADPGKRADSGVTLTVKANYPYSYSSYSGNYMYQTTTFTYTVATGEDFSGDVYGYYSYTNRGQTYTTDRTISGISVTSGSATASNSGNTINVKNITENTTVRVTYSDLVNNAPVMKNQEYDKPDTTEIAPTPEVNETHAFDFTVTAADGWKKEFTAEELNIQAGHTYKYWVKEVTVPGYDTTVTFDSETNSLDASTAEDKLITISNVRSNPLIVEKKWYNNDGTDIRDTSELPAITGTLYQNDYKVTPGQKADPGVTLTVNAYYRYYDWSSYSYQTTTTTIGTYTVATNGNYSATVYGYYQGYYSTAERTISGISVTSGNAATSNSGNDISVTGISENTTVLVSYNTGSNQQLTTAPTLNSVSYDTPQGGTEGSETFVGTKAIGTFELSYSTNEEECWRKVFSPKELGEQSGHRYTYYVDEVQVPGYSTGIDYYDKDHSLERSDVDRTITISNTKGYELPSTGGFGTLPLEVGGSAALLGSMVVGYSRRRRDGKEGE